jgi:hypothetical protein
MVPDLPKYGPILTENYHFRKSTLSKKWDVFFLKKRPCGECQPGAPGLFSPKCPGERPLKYGGYSLNTTSNLLKYGPQFNKIWSHFDRKLPFQEKYPF